MFLLLSVSHSSEHVWDVVVFREASGGKNQWCLKLSTDMMSLTSDSNDTAHTVHCVTVLPEWWTYCGLYKHKGDFQRQTMT